MGERPRAKKMRRETWAIFLPLVLSSCASTTPVTTETSSEENSGLVYVVHPGDTLSVIALQHGESYRDIARWNNIPPPYAIQSGQRLRLTPPATAANPPTNQGAPPTPKPEIRNKVDSSEAVLPSTSETVPPAAEGTKTVRKLQWQWPTSGHVVRGFSQSTKGLDIGGREADPVYAAADGTVVYTGAGIIGYGPMIILRHNSTYLSAYAHNKRMLVKEGDHVTQGQQIAEMGVDQRHRALLHFEIRRNSKSVDPTVYLPER